MKKFYAILLSLGLMISPLNAKAASMGLIANQILGLGTAVVGTSVLLVCKLGSMLPSVTTFMGGSVVYIASEFLGASAKKAHLKAQEVNIEEMRAKMKEGGDLQKASIEAKLKEEKDQLGFVKKRKMWMMAVGAVYLIATTLALVENVELVAATATVAGAAVLQPPYMQGVCEPASGVGTVTALEAAIIMAYSFTSMKSGGSSNMIAGAGGVILAGLVYFLPAATKTLLTTIGSALNTPMSRAVVFGAAAALTAVVIMDLMSIEKKLQSNVEKMEKLLAEFNKNSKSDNELAESGTSNGGIPGETAGSAAGLSAGGNFALKQLATGQAAKNRNCISMKKNNFEYSEKACAAPLKVNRPKFNSNFATNDLKSSANLAADFTQSVANGDEARAEILAGQLANSAARLNLQKKSALAKLNEQRKKNKQKPLDFDGEVNKMVSRMASDVNKALAPKGLSLNNLPDRAVTKEEIEAATSSTINNIKGHSAEIDPSSDLNSPSNENTEEASASSAPIEEAKLEDSLENYESNESDILNQKETSIFRQLSNRYLLNYRRFFRVEEDEKAPEAPGPVESK